MLKSWLTEKAASRKSATAGSGIYAVSPILVDEAIAVWAGRLYGEEAFGALASEQRVRSVQVAVGAYLVPSQLAPGDFVNHSCDPNAGLAGDRTLVAMRDILPGEEITYDYAMTDYSAYDEFDCACGASCCRKIIRGGDWKLPSLQARYRGYFSSYLELLLLSDR